VCLSNGVFQPRVFRGLLLRAIATAARSSALCALRSVPFGKYWRSSPLVFSGQGVAVLEKRGWDDLRERVMVASYSASRSLRTAAI
jgi:hypothetical protein